MVQLGTNEEEANVFRAHAVPQGLCEDVIKALELLANLQSEGESPIQSIVTGLREKKQGTYCEWFEKLHWTIIVPWRWATCAKASGLSGSKNRK